MPYYNSCPDCGANLDPGEKCDCQEKEKTPDTPEAYQGQATRTYQAITVYHKAEGTVKHDST